MTIRLCHGLDDLNLVVGADFPQADEDALWRCAQAWAQAATQLRQLRPLARLAGEQVAAGLVGEGASAFAHQWSALTADGHGGLDRLAQACDELASACRRAAVEVEYAKISYIAALIILAATLTALIATIWAGGASAAGIPVAVAAAQVTVRAVLVRLVSAIVLGGAINLAVDGLTQQIQLSAGHREQWDWHATGRAAVDGAIYGAVGGGVFWAGGRLVPALLGTRVGVVVGAAATGVGGGIVAPLVHGELPRPRDVLLAASSGLVGGVGPDLVTHRALGHDAPWQTVASLAQLDPVAHQLTPTDTGPTGSAVTGSAHLPPPAAALPAAALPAATLTAGRVAVGDVPAHDLRAGPAPPPPIGPDPSEPVKAVEPGGALWVEAAPELTDQQATDLVQAHAFVTAAGMAFYPVDDQIRDFAFAVVPAPGYVTLDVHGSPHGFLIDDQLIGPSQFASALRRLVDGGVLVLPDGTGIKLLSCDTAVGGDESPAAVLARELGVEVIAPDQPVWTGLDGAEVVASAVLVHGVWLPAEPPDGSWHRFVGATSGSDTVRRSRLDAPRQ